MRPLPFYAALFAGTLSTLMLQVLQTRILSVVSWYHLAFFAISLAMFGLTAGAVWVHRYRHRFTDSTLPADLTYFTSAFAVTIALSLAVQMTLAPAITLNATAALIWAELALCLAVPFACAGVVITLALTRSPFAIGRVYGVDLLGAALGCLVVLPLLEWSDGPGAVLWASTIVAFAAILFSRCSPAGVSSEGRPFGSFLMRPSAVLATLILVALAHGLSQYGLHPIFIKGQAEPRPIFEAWNSFSRVAVFEERVGTPQMWGPSPTFRDADWSIGQRGMNIDGQAFTATYRLGNGHLNDAAFLRYDVTNLAYFLPNLSRAAIIGIGGGRDMLSARVFGVPSITGVEINPVFVRLLLRERGYAEFTGLHTLAGMTFVVDEARSWFARTVETFDVIQMSLIDTWASTGAGAFTLSENSLYTVEAWRLFLDHLTPGGVFTVSRWYEAERPAETGRLISLAAAAAFASGAREPRRHMFVAASGRVATLILSKTPLSADIVAALERATTDLRYTILVAPDREPSSDILRRILAGENREALDRYTATLDLDLSPPTDENPFFFNQLSLSNPLKTLRVAFSTETGQLGRGNLFATATLAILLMIALFLVSVTIIVPLRPTAGDLGRRFTIAGTTYFLLIGVGFMVTEIGLLQRMSVFLGHPTYALSIVLFSMILAAGIGSLASDKWALTTGLAFTVWGVLISSYLGALALWLPRALLTAESLTLGAKAVLCISIICPAGFLMGFGFPTGMRMASAVDRAPTAWFWGINGAAGVLASIIAVALSLAYGIRSTLVVGAACYLLLIASAWGMGFPKEQHR
jgi:spermidine synthase